MEPNSAAAEVKLDKYFVEGEAVTELSPAPIYLMRYVNAVSPTEAIEKAKKDVKEAPILCGLQDSKIYFTSIKDTSVEEEYDGGEPRIEVHLPRMKGEGFLRLL